MYNKKEHNVGFESVLRECTQAYLKLSSSSSSQFQKCPFVPVNLSKKPNRFCLHWELRWCHGQYITLLKTQLIKPTYSIRGWKVYINPSTHGAARNRQKISICFDLGWVDLHKMNHLSIFKGADFSFQHSQLPPTSPPLSQTTRWAIHPSKSNNPKKTGLLGELSCIWFHVAGPWLLHMCLSSRRMIYFQSSNW